ncbi:hypothetical protein B0H10DRAFT_2286465 [Mycena sp. CBHHK59/15]|nr:hypothetical protein B0H10DRAFT_2286465 [Mycena sp. CBHHK59/15]
MSIYTSFAVFGAGLVGVPIARALHAQRVSVLVLTRPGSVSAVGQHLPPGIPLIEVDYGNSAAITQLLQEYAVQVVVSTISAAAVPVQNQVADAAKAAGVELFAPSEFGIVTEGPGPRDVNHKSTVLDHLVSIRLPFARFYVGFFTEIIPALTGFSVNGKINIVGTGEMPCSFTASDDIAGFVAHVLTTLPRSELFNRTFRLQGDRLSLVELAQLFKTEVQYVDKVPGQMSEVWTRMHEAAECGLASTGWNVFQWREGQENAGSTNYLWEGHQWKSVKDFYRL